MLLEGGLYDELTFSAAETSGNPSFEVAAGINAICGIILSGTWHVLVPACVVMRTKVDINGDGMMEWDEFTRFVVVKAQLHHAQMSIDQLAEYRQGPRQAS